MYHSLSHATATHVSTRFINCQRSWSSYETFTEADIARCVREINITLSLNYNINYV